MQRRKLGNSNLEVSAPGIGCMEMSYSYGPARNEKKMIVPIRSAVVSGERNISEIAYQLGFENPPYFSRLFKKEVGICPKEYKSQLLN
ncbi:MAG: helix-turn-helix domain-containing protein [Bacteroidota bacterium]|nr:helix-turn-helix domain-containing protein [Bacteroidota bacterium]